MPTSDPDPLPPTMGRLDRWRSRLWELARFGAIGACAYVIDVGLFNLLTHTSSAVLSHKPVTAKVISVTVATIFSWVGNRYWTFAGKRSYTPAREFIAFALVNLGGMAIAAACLWCSRYVFHLTSALADNISGNIIGTGLGTVFRFLCYKYLVFAGAPTEPNAIRQRPSRAGGDSD